MRAKTTSLIQVGKFEDIASTLKENARSTTEQYLPLIVALTQLAKAGSGDTDAIKNIIDLLKELRIEIAEAKRADQTRHETNIGIWDKSMKDLLAAQVSIEGRIETLTTRNTRLQSSIDSNTKIVASAKIVKDDSGEVVKSKTTELETK